jgi:hypothetical protein
MKWQSLERAAAILNMKPATLRRRAERAFQREPLEHLWLIAPGVWAQRMFGGRWFLILEPEPGPTESPYGNSRATALASHSHTKAPPAPSKKRSTEQSRSSRLFPDNRTTRTPFKFSKRKRGKLQ